MSSMAPCFWHEWFNSNESPYFSMFRCGCNGVSIEEVSAYCQQLGIPVRQKDIENWQNGFFNYGINHRDSVLNPIMSKPTVSENAMRVSLDSFELWPEGWKGTDIRWFPCSEENMPMQKWGYSKDYQPTLYTREVAQALSPCGFVGQNMYAQPFIVIDIDGVGHGLRDEQVIAFGNKYRNMTETWEAPEKPGSFHLYFNTNRIIPVCHFSFAKLDLMGNKVNAAVYTKNKRSNGIPRSELTSEIWEDLQDYLLMRKEQRYAQSV